MSGPFDTDPAFQSDGQSPYCAKCELLSWMHPKPKGEDR